MVLHTAYWCICRHTKSQTSLPFSLVCQSAMENQQAKRKGHKPPTPLTTRVYEVEPARDVDWKSCNKLGMEQWTGIDYPVAHFYLPPPFVLLPSDFPFGSRDLPTSPTLMLHHHLVHPLGGCSKSTHAPPYLHSDAASRSPHQSVLKLQVREHEGWALDCHTAVVQQLLYSKIWPCLRQTKASTDPVYTGDSRKPPWLITSNRSFTSNPFLKACKPAVITTSHGTEFYT